MSFNKLQDEANKDFSNFYGNYFEDDNFAGQQERIRTCDRTLVFSIENTDTANDLDAEIFGGYAEAAQPTGIDITVQNGQTHAQVRRRSLDHPFLIYGAKFKTTDTTNTQFDQAIIVTKTNDANSQDIARYYPANMESPANQNEQIIDDREFQLLVDGDTSLTITVLAGTTFTCIFTLRSKINDANSLIGKGRTEVNTAPRLTGNPPADIQIEWVHARQKALKQMV